MAETPTSYEVLAAYRQQIAEQPEQLIAANVPYTQEYYEDSQMRAVATTIAHKELFGDSGSKGTVNDFLATHSRVQELIRPEGFDGHEYDAQIEERYKKLTPLISTIQAQRLEDWRLGDTSREYMIAPEVGMIVRAAATPRPKRAANRLREAIVALFTGEDSFL